MIFELSIKDTCIVKGGKRLPKGHQLLQSKTKHPYIRTRDLNDHKININEIEYITTETHKEIEKYIVDKGNLIISIVGTVGSCAIIPDNLDKANLTENCAKIVPKDSSVDTNFLYYFLISKIGQNEIYKNTVGSTQLKLPLYGIENIKIPSIDEKSQARIADFLSTLDKKIELNQKMNETLEEIAKTLFKSWFIEFDPVRAKVEGRSTGLSKEISDLFPDSFEDSDSGEIPKGWKLGRFGDLVEPQRGKVITRSMITPGKIPVVAGGIKPPYFHNKLNAVSPVITISASGTAGYVSIYYEDIWASDCSYINEETSKYVFFIYSFLKTNQDKVYYLRHGAVQQHVYPKDLIELEIIIPDISILEEYENTVSILHKKIKSNLDESKKLVNIRDILLPKLISGDLKISNAEKIVNEANL